LHKTVQTPYRVQIELMSVNDRLTLLGHVMDGGIFLLVPAPEKTTDPWLVPPDFARYYNETQFAAAQTQLQSLGMAYHEGDAFKFSRAANALRDELRKLSPKIY